MSPYPSARTCASGRTLKCSASAFHTCACMKGGRPLRGAQPKCRHREGPDLYAADLALIIAPQPGIFLQFCTIPMMCSHSTWQQAVLLDLSALHLLEHTGLVSRRTSRRHWQTSASS